MNFKIPDNWIETTLDEVASWGSGGTPSRAISSYYNGTIPWVKTGDLNDSVLSEVDEKITDAGLKNSSAKIFPRGSVVIAMYGATIGKTAILGMDAATNQACGVAQPYDGISNKYLFYYLKSQKQNFIDKGKGGAQPNISQAVIKQHPFPLPPTNEQKRIANKLDLLFQSIDSLNQRLDEIPVLLKRFKEILITRAINGDLTKEWRENKENISGSELIEKVVFARKTKKSKSARLQISLRKDLDLFDIPREWVWVDLDFLFDEDESFCYGVVQPGDDYPNGPKLIRVKDLDNWKVIHDELRTISPDIDKAYKRSKVKDGNLLISIVGTIGRTAIVSKDEEGFNIARAIAKIPIKDFDSKFINIFLSSNIAQRWLLDDAREVARKTLNLEQLKTLPVPIPSLTEQREIVRRVEQLLSITDRIERRYEVIKMKMEQFPKSFFDKAFTGVLVEQSKDDESARVLLNRILKSKKTKAK